MARGIYVVGYEDSTISNASGDYDLIEISSPDDRPLEIVSWHISQNTEFGDAAEEQLRLGWVRGNTTTGNGGALTAAPTVPSDETTIIVAEGPSSTPASAGTAVTLHPFTWNVRVPYDYFAPPEERLRTNQATGFLCLRLFAAVVDDLDLSLAVYVAEL